MVGDSRIVTRVLDDTPHTSTTIVRRERVCDIFGNALERHTALVLSRHLFMYSVATSARTQTPFSVSFVRLRAARER